MNRSAALALALLAITQPVLALDPACAPVVAAFQARLDAPVWYSLTQLEGMKLEAKADQGRVLSRVDGGAWRELPNQIGAEQELIDSIATGESVLTGCQSEAGAAIDGVPVTVYRYRLALPGAPVANARLHVGADGRPYLQEDADDTLSVRYRYDGAAAE